MTYLSSAGHQRYRSGRNSPDCFLHSRTRAGVEMGQDAAARSTVIVALILAWSTLLSSRWCPGDLPVLSVDPGLFTFW